MKRMYGLLIGMFMVAATFSSVSNAEQRSLPQAVSQGVVRWQSEGYATFQGAGLQWSNFRINAPKDYIKVSIPLRCANYLTVQGLKVNGGRVNPFSGMVENYDIPWARVHVWNDGYAHNRAYETNPGMPTPEVASIQVGLLSQFLIQGCDVEVSTAMRDF